MDQEMCTQIDVTGLLCPATDGDFGRKAVADEELRQAVGQNALLHAEIHRRLAEQLVRLRAEAGALRHELEALQRQQQSLSRGVAWALEWSRPEHASEGTAAAGAENAGVPFREAAGAGMARVPRLLAPQKLLALGEELRVNLGCGTKPAPEYFNVDERELPGVDLLADVRALPFQPGTVAEIYAAHLVEHFTQPYLQSTLLPTWQRLLKPGGRLRVVVPDAEGMIAAFSRGEYPFESLREVTYGGQDYPGNFHYTMFSRESLRAVLRATGFEPGEYTALARPNGLCLEMEITASKPA